MSLTLKITLTSILIFLFLFSIGLFEDARNGEVPRMIASLVAFSMMFSIFCVLYWLLSLVWGI